MYMWEAVRGCGRALRRPNASLPYSVPISAPERSQQQEWFERQVRHGKRQQVQRTGFKTGCPAQHCGLWLEFIVTKEVTTDVDLNAEGHVNQRIWGEGAGEPHLWGNRCLSESSQSRRRPQDGCSRSCRVDLSVAVN